MPRLFIAEKRNLGAAIAEGLGIVKTQSDHIVCKNGDIVTWASGHLMEMAPPDKQDPKWEKWDLASLPIFPDAWRKTPIGDKRSCLPAIKKFLADPSLDTVVHAGDPDREGQLIVDEILEHFHNRKKVRRILAADLSPAGVARALANIRPNDEFRRLYESALCRERADYALGMSVTRALTVLARNAGAAVRVVPFGRVQTPTLALVVTRQEEIDNFVSKPYYVIYADVAAQKGTFRTVWTPKDGQPGMDPEGRLTDREIADKIVKRIGTNLKNGVVSKVETKPETEQPPSTFDLTSFQAAMGKYGVSPKNALAIAQSLYDRKFTTYPRSAHKTLPATQLPDAPKVLDAIVKGCAGAALGRACRAADPKRRSKVWLDDFTAEHHAIIPTGVPATGLSGDELIGYKEIAARYVWQFLPPMEGRRTVILVSAPLSEGEDARETFRATGLIPVKLGWREFAEIEGLKTSRKDAKKKGVKRGAEDEDETEDDERTLPEVAQGEKVDAQAGIQEKKTMPPKPFTQTSLVTAMQRIGLYVEDPKIRKLLLREDIQGIGTVATRAAIVDGLLKKGLMQEVKGKLRPTPDGVALIGTVRGTAFEKFMTPETTGVWEMTLEDISEGRGATMDAFMSKMKASLTDAVKNCSSIEFKGTAAARAVCPYCGKESAVRLRGKFGYFFKCSSCGETARDADGKPVKKTGGTIEKRDCPLCGGKETLSRLPLRAGGFKWHCENKKCNVWLDDGADGPVAAERAECPLCKKPILKKTAKSGKTYWSCTGCGVAFFSDTVPTADTPHSEPAAPKPASKGKSTGRPTARKHNQAH